MVMSAHELRQVEYGLSDIQWRWWIVIQHSLDMVCQFMSLIALHHQPNLKEGNIVELASQL